MAKKTHLTDTDRLQIEILLKQRYPLNKISERVGKAKSTIAREIKKRALESEKFAVHYPHNRCEVRKECQRVQLLTVRENMESYNAADDLTLNNVLEKVGLDIELDSEVTREFENNGVICPVLHDISATNTPLVSYFLF